MIFHLVMKNYRIEYYVMMWCKCLQMCLFSFKYFNMLPIFIINIMEYLAELDLFCIYSDFSLIPLLTNDFSLNHKSVSTIYLLVYSVLILKNLTGELTLMHHSRISYRSTGSSSCPAPSIASCNIDMSGLKYIRTKLWNANKVVKQNVEVRQSH